MRHCFHIANLGCRVNRAECDQSYLTLTEHGWIPSDIENANLIIINTCIVTAQAAKKTRKAFRHIIDINDHAKIIVSGCASEIDASFFQSANSRVEVVPKVLLSEVVDHHAQQADSTISPETIHSIDDINHDFLDGRVRIGVKVQDGCNNACTYCIVHTARGKEVSIPVDSVIEQVKRLNALGIAEVVLSGINLARYQYQDISLVGLLERLLDLNLDCRFRISSVEPNDIDFGLAAFLEEHDGKVCRHLHLPLQSGSSKVLSEMGRKYSAEDFLNKTDSLKAISPSLSLTTDVICGFPGETEEDFKDTLALCESVGFSKIHVFPYSQREGTPAADRSDQIDTEIRKERARILRDLSKELRMRDLEKRKGTRELCVVEDKLVATTESYHEVRPPESAKIGSLVFCDL